MADSMYVRFDRGRHDTEGPTFGPFPFVQMTYSGLRVGPNGDWLAYHCGDDEWRIDGLDEPFSDATIYAGDPDTEIVYATIEHWKGTAECQDREAARQWVEWDAELNEEAPAAIPV